MYGFIMRVVLLATVATMVWEAAPRQSYAGKKDDTLVVALQRGIRSLDRLYTRRREGLIFAQLTDDGLFYADPKTLRFIPLAAKSHKFLDPKTLDVTVREGVKFHDGSPLNADDVVYTYNWVLNKKSKSRNTKRVRRWLKSVEKVGPMKVRFRLKRPYPLALRDMAISIYLRKKNAYHAGGGKRGNRKAMTNALNGLGPYRVVDFDPGKRIVLERFEGYYRSSPKPFPAIRRIEARTIPDWGTQQAELMSGGVQWMYSVPTDIAENIGKTPLAQHIAGPSLRVGFVILDAIGYTGRNNPLTKLEVRQAMNHAINREAIVRHIVKGSSKVIHSACHPVQFGCAQDVKKYDYNPQKAKALLAKAGYENGFAFELWAYREKSVAEAITADLHKVGIRAKLRYVKLSTLSRARKSREIPAYFATWGSGSTADTAAIATFHFSPTTNRNLSRDKEVEKYVMAAEGTLDPAKRKEAYARALRLIAERALWIPLYSFTLNYLTSNDLAFEAPKDGLPRLFLARWK